MTNAQFQNQFESFNSNSFDNVVSFITCCYLKPLCLTLDIMSPVLWVCLQTYKLTYTTNLIWYNYQL